MNNDLISREALKKELAKEIKTNDMGLWLKILLVIDNAPTVERPQGEWGKWVITEIQCPKCFEYFETDCYSTEELNKCPNCGAKMQKGRAEKGGKNEIN